jgi:hypothetical protein
VSGVKSWEETQVLLCQEKAIIDPAIEVPGWQWRKKTRMWTGPGDASGD